MMNEFKTFIMRGNVVDLAVAVIVANAFSAIVDSLISDVITPLLLKPAMTALHVDKLSNLGWNGVLYGKFIAATITFVVTTFIIFILVKALNKARLVKSTEGTTQTTAEPLTKDQELLAEIRDLLKKESR
jgi:large conductance mechanosensitive channel